MKDIHNIDCFGCFRSCHRWCFCCSGTCRPWLWRSFQVESSEKRNIQKKTDSASGLLDDAVAYSDSANDLNVTYLMSSDVDDSLVNKTLKDLKDKGANVTKTGDMYKIDANGLNGALRIKDVELVMVVTTHFDMDTVVSMVESLSS